VTVVSSDHRLHSAIRKRRGTAIDSELFLERLDLPDRRRISTGQSASQDRNPLSEADLWAREFGDIDPNSLQNEILDQSQEPKTDWDNQIEDLERFLQNGSSIDAWLNEKDRRKPPQ